MRGWKGYIEVCNGVRLVSNWSKVSVPLERASAEEVDRSWIVSYPALVNAESVEGGIDNEERCLEDIEVDGGDAFGVASTALVLLPQRPFAPSCFLELLPSFLASWSPR